MSTEQVISKSTERRFVLGKQGLYPGRRWRGKGGVAAALQAGAAVQVDPIHVVACSHDIALYGRVLDYEPVLLWTLLYQDRIAFEAGEMSRCSGDYKETAPMTLVVIR
jgi:uncharacterized protein